MKKDVTISYNELMKELDSFRGTPIRKIEFTEEQIKFIKKCRNHKKPISYRIMSDLWFKLGWDKIAPTTLASRCKEYEEN